MTLSERRKIRAWFYSAAVYNVVWGTSAVLFPNAFFDFFGMRRPNYPSLFQAIGMIVGVYAFGYYLVGRNPERYGPFVWVGLAGKLFGPIGFLMAALAGDLPWSFGWINVTNDLIWLPFFAWFALRFAKEL